MNDLLANFYVRMQIAALVLTAAAYAILRYNRHPHPIRRMLLLWIILAPGLLIISIAYHPPAIH